MKAFLALSALLAAAMLVPAPVAGAADTTASLCYNYLFVHDYQWYFLCVDPKDAACPVYTVKSNDPRYPSGEPDCVVDAPTFGTVALRCIPLASDLEYTHSLCVDPRDPSCAVYLLREAGGHSTRTCLGVPLAA